MTLLLSVQDLSKSYGHRPLFVGLSLDLRAGERVGLVGPQRRRQIDAGDWGKKQSDHNSPIATSPGLPIQNAMLS